MKLNTVKLGLAAIAVIAAVLTSCRNDTPIPQIRETGGIKVVYPEGLTVISVKEDTLTFTNRTTGVSKKAAFGDTITLSNGLYDCFYNAVATYTDKQGTAADGEFYGAVTSVEIGDGAPDFTIEAHLRSEKGDFIIEEIFFTGTLYPTGKQYYGDGYVKIYNNTGALKLTASPNSTSTVTGEVMGEYAVSAAFTHTAFVQLDVNDYVLVEADGSRRLPLKAHAHQANDFFTALRIAKEFGLRWAGFVMVWTTGQAYLLSTLFYQSAIIQRGMSYSAGWIIGIILAELIIFTALYLIGKRRPYDSF